MHQQLSANTNEGRAFAEDAQALLNATAEAGGKRVEDAGRRLGAALAYGRKVCGTARSKMIASAKPTRGSAMKTLLSLLVVLGLVLRQSFGATNESCGTPGGTVIALPGHIFDPQSRSDGITTTIRENVLFQHALKEMDTNNLNASSNGKLLALGQQPASTNSVLPTERIALGLVDVASVPRISRRPESFSEQDKYGGILYKGFRAEHPLQLLNPFAPREYGQREVSEFPHDRLTDFPSGLTVFSIRFK
jgi:hypothetical protein